MCPETEETERRIADLVERARQGDRGALEELFATYYGPVYRMARIRLGSRLRRVLDSTDIAQETFLQVVHGLERYEHRGAASIIQWLARIVENEIRDARRRMDAQKRDGGSGLEAGAAIFDALAGRQGTPSEAASDAELREVYDSCVEQLDETSREIVLMREYAEAPWEEIATALGLTSPRVARDGYRRAKIRLGALLATRLRR